MTRREQALSLLLCLSIPSSADAQRGRGGSTRPPSGARPQTTAARPVATTARPTAARATPTRAVTPVATPTVRRGGLAGGLPATTRTSFAAIGGNAVWARPRQLYTGPAIYDTATPISNDILARRRAGVYGGTLSLLGADYTALAAPASFGTPTRPPNVNRPWAGRYPWYHGGWNGWGAWPATWNPATVAVPVGIYNNPYAAVRPLSPTYLKLELSPGLRSALDYTRPIRRSAGEVRPEVVEAAHVRMGAARTAFQRGDYKEGLAQADRAAGLLPEDANLHEFRALSLFALRRYHESAQVLHAVLSSEPGWGWETVRSFYPDADTYTKQLRDLENHVEAEPADAASRFVLAYHYLVLDERAEAAKQLREVARLEPDDRLAASLADALARAGEGTGRPGRKR